jgi:putative chitinase
MDIIGDIEAMFDGNSGTATVPPAPAAVPAAPAAPAPAEPTPTPPSSPLLRALAAVAPHLKPQTRDGWVAAMQPPMTSSGILANNNRIAAFTGEVAYESGGFVDVIENLNYSAARMMQVWPTHFTSLEQAQGYAYQPEKLANHVYASRNGNGDEASGDGWLFRGRGLIQLTGRANYTAFAAAMKRALADTTDWVSTDEGAAAAACWFWSTRSLNTAADTFDIETITRRINGGTTGLQTRIALCNAALHALT